MRFVVSNKSDFKKSPYYDLILAVAIVFGVLFPFGIFAQTVNPVSEDFESLNTGQLSGQDDWTGSTAFDVVSSGSCPEGDQCALSTTGSAWTAKPITTSTFVVQSFLVNITTANLAGTQQMFLLSRDTAINAGDVSFSYATATERFQWSRCYNNSGQVAFAEDDHPPDSYLITLTAEINVSCSVEIQSMTTGEEWTHTYNTPGSSGTEFTHVLIGGNATDDYFFDGFGLATVPDFDFDLPELPEALGVNAIDIDSRVENASSTIDTDFTIHYNNRDEGVYSELVYHLYDVDNDIVVVSATTTAATGTVEFSDSFDGLPQDKDFEIWSALRFPTAIPFALQTPMYRRSFTTDMSIDIVFEDPGWQPCGISNLEGCLVNAGRFLFFPDPSQINSLISETNTMRGKFPLGYVTEAQEIFATSLGSDDDFEVVASGTVDVGDGTDITLSLFNTEDIRDSDIIPFDLFRTLMIYSVYAFFALWAYRKAVEFRMKDV